MPDLRSTRLAPWIVLASLLALCWLAYRPGLAGGFLFDDFVNLPALGATGPIDNWDAFWRYLTSGTADPTGRPLSLLSFLIDARDWPADPAPFLRTNLLLHLLNGTLLFCLLRMLGRRLDGRDAARTGMAAALGAGIWLLHPFFVSTTLYIVQREALLPATFVLCGLLAWTHGRSRLATAPRAGIAWMVFAVVACTPLAIASKANGVLLPLLIWVIEATILRSDGAAQSKSQRILTRVLLVLPSVLVIAYLLVHARHPDAAIPSRPWTIGERLLTEPRVLLDYLMALVVPRVLTTGLYNDAYVASSGLLHPPSTLAALMAVLLLVAIAFASRRRAPALSAALLFFFAGHLLESSSIALELYFEHRNYLPAMLLPWPLARALTRWRAGTTLRTLAAVAVLSLLAATTWQRASLWARQDHMAYLWAAKSPASSRAQATAAIFEIRAGRPELAAARLEARARARPGDLQLVVNRISALCRMRGLSPADVDAAATALRTATEGDQLVHRWLAGALDNAVAGDCPGMDMEAIGQWLEAARANPRLRNMPGRQQDLLSLAGRLALARQQPREARLAFDRALDASPTPQAALSQAGLLASRGCYVEALGHLDHFERLPRKRPAARRWSMQRLHEAVLQSQGFWPREFDSLRARINDDLRSKGNGACGR